MSDEGLIDPVEEPFSAFVFKIQANMNKAHRDRIAFMRICSGKFNAGMDVFHVQGGNMILVYVGEMDKQCYVNENSLNEK